MENKPQYICFAKGVEQFDVKGNSLGIGHDRAIYYSRSIGRKRFYRNAYPNPNSSGLTLLTFGSEKGAKSVCDLTLEVHNDNFEVVNINPLPKAL